jgi:hypothetical protein
VARWRERSAWIVRTVLLACGIYVVSGILIGGIAFGDRGESPAASAAVAIAAGVVALACRDAVPFT